MGRPITDAHKCEVCGKRVSRILGVGSKVVLEDDRIQVRSAVLGYCATHRDEVIPVWLDRQSADGQAESLGESVDLRPQDAHDFVVHANRFLAEGWAVCMNLAPRTPCLADARTAATACAGVKGLIKTTHWSRRARRVPGNARTAERLDS